MSWITLTSDDVLRRLSGPEKTSYSTAAKASGQEDPLPGIIASVTREVRARVAACATNKLGEGATIPDELEDHALVLIRYRLTTRLPGIKIDENRQKEYDQAVSVLKDVARCEFSIEPPASVSAEVRPNPLPSISGRTPSYGRDEQEGI